MYCGVIPLCRGQIRARTGMGARVIVADLNDAVIACKSVRWHPNYDLFFDKVHTGLRSLMEPFAKEHILGVGASLGFIDKASGKVIATENLNWFSFKVAASSGGACRCFSTLKTQRSRPLWPRCGHGIGIRSLCAILLP